jgi:hypothetical protein
MHKPGMPGNIPLYLLILVLANCAFGLLPFIDTSKADLFYYVAVLLALATGVMAIYLSGKLQRKTPGEQAILVLWLSVLAMLIAVAVMTTIYYYTGLNIQFVTFIIAFIIPGICLAGYRYFLET